ncbi:hypothetical protein M0657_011111 [Pyricularia oryzae]|uniref:Uncharacterized protein n=2 Tax=Pyricularia oryzae TaxID=318829 RepID=A0AA97NWW8_PYRO3|nr:hypothetical protein OOU_Y34scaffold00586g5 [Pyricularia oryzae Y34]KAI7910313.1 hypothetical protein M9X92_011173 [Pyricularia oryzae]KAI7911098.1 hypothetical protein M0657_011111 [Pyricularia oryzae]
MASPSPLSLADSAHSFVCFPLNHAIQHGGNTPSFKGNNVTKLLPLEKQLTSRSFSRPSPSNFYVNAQLGSIQPEDTCARYTMLDAQ